VPIPGCKPPVPSPRKVHEKEERKVIPVDFHELFVLSGAMRGELGKKPPGREHHEEPQRKLEYPVRVVQNGNDPALQKRTEHATHQRIHLIEGKPHRVGKKEHEHAPEFRIVAVRPLGEKRHPQLPVPSPLKEQLGQAAKEDRRNKTSDAEGRNEKKNHAMKFTFAQRRCHGGTKKESRLFRTPMARAPRETKRRTIEKRPG
jgi:hypothetical protein